MSGAPASAATIAQEVRAGRVQARQVVAECLAAVEARDAQLRSFVHLARAEALAAAEAIDARVARGEDPGPLAGVPVGIKDNLCTAGLPTGAGSRILAGYVPPDDATAVARLRAAGAVVLGKTNMDEFAMGSSTEHSAHGPTRNPAAPARVPGGSSGGSAAAVAAGFVPLALGSDTGGSIRQPAALCGCVGVKPTYGLVSRLGLIAFASSLDQVGPLARDVGDAALCLDALWGPDPGDMTSRDPRRLAEDQAVWAEPRPFSAALAARRGLAGVVLGRVPEWQALTSDPEVRASIEAALRKAEAAGARIVDVPLALTRFAVPAYYVIATAEASANLARYDGVRYGHRTARAGDAVETVARSRAEGFGPEVRRRILLGTFVLSSGFYEAYYLRALKARARIEEDLLRGLAGVDALVGPTTPGPAFALGEKADPLEMYACDLFTVSANLAGLPALSLPCGRTAAGLPVGLQLTGRPFSDPRLLAVARGLEEALS